MRFPSMRCQVFLVLKWVNISIFFSVQGWISQYNIAKFTLYSIEICPSRPRYGLSGTFHEIFLRFELQE